MLGLSAACGKAGAAIGTVAFGAIRTRLGNDQGVFLIGGAFSVLGGIVTLLCIPHVSLLLPLSLSLIHI